MRSIDELLQTIVEAGASDLHIKSGSPPVMRVDGELQSLDDPSCGPEDTKDYAASLMSDKQIRRFSETNEIDFAYSAPKIGRFRVNVYRQRGSISIALRAVATRIADFEEPIPRPPHQKLSVDPGGLVLFPGPTGWGKTPPPAAIIANIN